MVKKIISIIIVLALVFAGGYYTCLQMIPENTQEVTGPIYSTKEVTRGDIKVGVNITGQLNVTNYGGSVSAPLIDDFDGTLKFQVEEMFVKENDEIKKGDPVLRLSCTNLSKLITEKHEMKDSINSEIQLALSQLGSKINQKISSVDEVNPQDGIVITATIDGRISDLSVKEGERVTSSDICRIVDDSKLKITFKVTENEYQLYKVGQKVLLSYNGYEGYYNGEIKEINSNAVPNDDKKSYIHTGIIEAENPGLIMPGVSVGISEMVNGEPSNTLTYSGMVDSYLNQTRIYTEMYSNDGNKSYLATNVEVKDNDVIKKGQAIVRIAGSDVAASIQNDINEINNKLLDLRKIDNEILQLQLFSERLLVTASTDGVISWIRYNVGDNFDVNSTDTYSAQIMDVYNCNEMSIYTQVSDLDINYVQQDAKVEVTVDALPGKNFEGKVNRIYQYTRDGKTVYQVEIGVTGDEGLRPGMNTNCFIDAGESLNTLLVPIEAVYEEDYKQMVEIIDDEGNVIAVEIEIGLMNDRYVEVLSGLEEGQKVITGSSQDLMPSQKVENNNSLLPSTNK